MDESVPDSVIEHLPLIDSTTRWRLESEDLHIHNHDHASSYDITLDIRDGEATKHHGEYHLLPDQSGSSVNLLPAGEYTVAATVDGQLSKTAVIEVSDEPDQTIVVEIINGNLKITEGLS